MIIAVDGPDGAGKSTHAALLYDWLQEEQYDVVLLSKWDILGTCRPPEARLLRGTNQRELRDCVAQMPALARLLFIMWLYAEMATEAIARSADRIVVLDGFWMKHAAAELVYGGDHGLVDAIVRCLGSVDLVVYLDVTPAEALRRKGSELTPYECGMDFGLSHSRFLSRQAELRAILLSWCERYNWRLIPPGPVEATQKELRAVVGDALHAALNPPRSGVPR